MSTCKNHEHKLKYQFVSKLQTFFREVQERSNCCTYIKKKTEVAFSLIPNVEWIVNYFSQHMY